MATQPDLSQRPSVSIPDLSFLGSASVVRKMGTYSRERVMIALKLGGVIGGLLVVGILITALIGMYLSKTVAGVIFVAVCIGLVLGVMPYVEQQLFEMRAAFAYLATEILVKGQEVPQNDTVAFANQKLEEKLGSLGPVCEVHNQTRSIFWNFFRTFDRFDEVLPIDISYLRSALLWIANRIAPRIADIALSYALVRGEKTLAEDSKDAVALVAQNPKAILSSAVRSYLAERIYGGIFGFIFMAIACVAVFSLTYSASGHMMAGSTLPAEGAKTIGIFAAIFSSLFIGLPIGALASWFLRTAYLEPMGLAMILARFHKTIEGQTANAAMLDQIKNASSNLRNAGGLTGWLK